MHPDPFGWSAKSKAVTLLKVRSIIERRQLHVWVVKRVVSVSKRSGPAFAARNKSVMLVANIEPFDYLESFSTVVASPIHLADCLLAGCFVLHFILLVCGRCWPVFRSSRSEFP